jgi:hypothetical protein
MCICLNYYSRIYATFCAIDYPTYMNKDNRNLLEIDDSRGERKSGDLVDCVLNTLVTATGHCRKNRYI